MSDVFDPANLVLNQEHTTKIHEAQTAKQKPMKPRISDLFFLVPILWAEAAAKAVKSRWQLLCAFRIYFEWYTSRSRKGFPGYIVASNIKLCGGGISRHVKYATITKLIEVGLIMIVDSGVNGKNPRIAVVDIGQTVTGEHPNL
jgi:hypothetical protein